MQLQNENAYNRTIDISVCRIYTFKSQVQYHNNRFHFIQMLFSRHKIQFNTKLICIQFEKGLYFFPVA